MSERRGFFLVIEGLDGSGTTTQVELLKDYLSKLGTDVLATKEPTDTEIGASIRRFLRGELTMTPPAQALAFAADRLFHLSNEVLPAMKDGAVVVSDRYVLSSIAYQSLSLDPEWVRSINREALTPNLTVFLDVPPEACIERLTRRGGPAEYFERLESLQAIGRNYRRAIDGARLAGENICVLDGLGDVAAVQRQIVRALDCSDPGTLVPSIYSGRKISRSRSGGS